MYEASSTRRAFLVATALLLAPGCGKSSNEKSAETAEPTTRTPASEHPTSAHGAGVGKAAARRPEGPTGSIKGLVTITGETPEMPLLRRGSDPACDNGEMKAETIVVGAEGALANVLVRIKPGTVPAWTPPGNIIVDQKDCMYRPRVQGGVRGQTVDISNADATTHNVHARHLPLGRRQGTETIMNRAQPAGMAMSFTLGEEPVAKLKCDYHGWMQGYIVVSDNPYFGVSNKVGVYEIAEVPTGKHTIELWHEYYGLKTAEVTVEENGTATVDYSYNAESDDPMRAGDSGEDAGDDTADDPAEKARK